MNSIYHTFIKLLVALTVSGVCAFALDIQYAGSIEDALFAPTSIHVASDRLTVLEPFSQELRQYSPEGVVLTDVDIKGEANSLSRLSESFYIFCDRSGGRIVGIDIEQNRQTDYLGSTYLFSNPTDIVVDNGIVYVLDAGSGSVLAFDEQKTLVNRISISDNSGTRINYANCFDYHASSGQFFILDQTDSKIWVMKIDGSFVNKFGSFGAKRDQISRGGDLIVNSDGLVFVSDRYQNRVVVYTAEGQFETSINLASITGSGALAIPTGLAIDDDGLLYVASTEGTRIDVFYLNKPVTPFAVDLRLVSPEFGDTVATANLVLISQAEAPAGSDVVRHFQFELYLSDNLNDAVAQVANLAPTLEIDTAHSIQTHLAQWSVGQSLRPDSDYKWRTRVIYTDSTGSWSDFRPFKTSSLPLEFRLAQNYPNPFNPSTIISYEIPESGQVSLEIYNLLGRKIRTLVDEPKSAGRYEVRWDGLSDGGNSAATGVYFYRLATEIESQTRKMVLIK